MKIAVIGHGAIANYVRAQLDGSGAMEVAQMVRPGKEDARHTPPRVSDVADLPADCDLLVDCGGHAALIAHGARALDRGMDVLTVSLGALADQALFDNLASAAKRGGARLQIVSGAIGGLDALRSAATGTLESVTYTGRKPPAGWAGSPAEDAVDLAALTQAATHFQGSARDAALHYPKNANVAAAVALAGIGMDKTQVSLIADPNISANIHEITAKGDFGEMRFGIAGNGLATNPKSSALAAMSVVAAIRDRMKPISF